MEKTLDGFTLGQAGKVKKITATGAIRRRLYDMGITPSAEVKLEKFAPLGDPMQIRVRGYALTLRKAEAKSVLVEVKD